MDYIIVEARSTKDLVKEVMDKINKGYTPIGGVVVVPPLKNSGSVYSIHPNYIQSMIKK